MLEWLLLGLLPLGMDQAQAGQDTYQGKKLEDWLESLTRADGPGSHEALEALCTFGKSAVPGLVKILGDPNIESTIRAARTLSELGPEAVEALPARSRDWPPGTRWGEPRSRMSLFSSRRAEARGLFRAPMGIESLRPGRTPCDTGSREGGEGQVLEPYLDHRRAEGNGERGSIRA